nr:FAD-dependent oxidoreductase [Paracoccaceae bacterium]
PWHHRRVFPLPSYLIATEPLSPDLIARLAPGRRMMVETRARHSYFRISPDGSRILFGGRAAMVNIGLAKAARRLRQTLGEIWPELRDVKLTHAWTGNTGYSFGHMPHVGQAEGIHYAMGFSGGGTVLAPWLGRKAALQALELTEGETAFSVSRLEKRWIYAGGRPRFLQAANLWYRFVVDGREIRESRKD